MYEVFIIIIILYLTVQRIIHFSRLKVNKFGEGRHMKR